MGGPKLPKVGSQSALLQGRSLINSSMCKYAVNYYQMNCPLCFLLILIKMDTPDQVF
jgi:hypothetical protein